MKIDYLAILGIIFTTGICFLIIFTVVDKAQENNAKFEEDCNNKYGVDGWYAKESYRAYGVLLECFAKQNQTGEIQNE